MRLEKVRYIGVRVWRIFLFFAFFGFCALVTMALFDFFVYPLGQQQLEIVCGISAFIVLCIAVAWELNLLPDGVVKGFSEYGPVVPIYFLAVAAIFAYAPGRQYLSVVFTNFGYENAGEIAFVVVTAALAASFVLVKGLTFYLWHHPSVDRYSTDLHSIVCEKAQISPKQILRLARYRTIPEYRKFHNANVRATEIRLEAAFGAAVIALVIALTYWNPVSGTYQPSMHSENLFIPSIIMLLLAIASGLEGVSSHLLWRTFWTDYWVFVRDMTTPDNRILDNLNPVPRIYFDFDVDLKPQPERFARRIADRTRFKISKKPSWQEIEWIHWAKETERKIQSIDDALLKRYPTLAESHSRLMTMSKTFDENSFPSLVRDSFVLDALDIAETWPEIFESISELRNRFGNQNMREQRLDLFEMATRELESISSRSIIPTPTSVKWLLGFLGILLATTPYLLQFLAASSP